MSQSQDREVVHLRQDLKAAQEVIQLLEGENGRLKQSLQGVRRDHQRELLSVADAKSSLELKLREAENTIESVRSENQRLHGEVAEALEGRERQAALLKDVRVQVDGRLTRLVEALHAKDEELHRLQYTAQERERDRDRVQLLEKMLASREENVNSLLAQLSAARTEQAQVAAELRHKSMLVERQQSMTREEPHPAASSKEDAGKGDLLAIIPLYRQWSVGFCKDVEELEDSIDAILDTATDLKVKLEGGDPASLKQDRLRLQSRRALERERGRAHTGMLESASVHSENSALVHVHAIRANCDTSRHGMTKIRDTISYLRESLLGLQASADGVAGRPASPTTEPPPPPASPVRSDYWQTAAEERETRLQQVQTELYAAKERAMLAEASQRALEQQCARQEKENRHLQDSIQRLTNEASERQRQHSAAHDAHLTDMDAMRKKLSDALYAHTNDKSAVEDKYRAAAAQAAERWEAERSTLKDQLSAARIKLEELTQSEARTKSALEELRSAKHSMKVEHERLEAEMSELRGIYASQNQELRQTQEVADSLAQELAHVRAVLDFETQQQEHRDVRGVQSADFESWKRQRSRQDPAPRSASKVAAVPRQVVIHRR